MSYICSTFCHRQTHPFPFQKWCSCSSFHLLPWSMHFLVKLQCLHFYLFPLTIQEPIPLSRKGVCNLYLIQFKILLRNEWWCSKWMWLTVSCVLKQMRCGGSALIFSHTHSGHSHSFIEAQCKLEQQSLIFRFGTFHNLRTWHWIQQFWITNLSSLYQNWQTVPFSTDSGWPDFYSLRQIWCRNSTFKTLFLQGVFLFLPFSFVISSSHVQLDQLW